MWRTAQRYVSRRWIGTGEKERFRGRRSAHSDLDLEGTSSIHRDMDLNGTCSLSFYTGLGIRHPVRPMKHNQACEKRVQLGDIRK